MRKIFIAISFLVVGCTDKRERECVTLSDSDFAQNAKSEEEYEKGNIKKALLITNEIIKKNPNNYIAYSNRGVFKYKNYINKGIYSSHDIELIYDDFIKSIQICPNYPKTYRNLIRVSYELEDYERVIKYTDDYHKKFSPSSELLTKKADALYEQNKIKEAIIVLDEAIKMEPIDTFAYVVRGKCYRELGNLEKAIEDFDKVIKLDSFIYLAFHERAYCYMKLKDYKKAESDLTKAITLYSDRMESYFMMGTLKIEQKDTIAGCEYYSFALEFILNRRNHLNSNEQKEFVQKAINTYCK